MVEISPLICKKNFDPQMILNLYLNIVSKDFLYQVPNIILTILENRLPKYYHLVHRPDPFPSILKPCKRALTRLGPKKGYAGNYRNSMLTRVSRSIMVLLPMSQTIVGPRPFPYFQTLTPRPVSSFLRFTTRPRKPRLR